MNLKNTIYYSLSHLFIKRRLFMVSMIIMITGMILVFNTFVVYMSVYSDIYKERTLLGNARDKLYKVESTYVTFDFSYYEEYLDFLLCIDEESDIGMYQATSIPLSVKSDNYAMGGISDEITDTENQGDNTTVFQAMRMDNELIRTLGFGDDNGNEINLTVDEKDREEIAVGSGLGSYINIGDELTDNYSGTVYVVKYILAGDQKWIDGEILNESNVVSLDNYIIVPLDLKEYDEYDCAALAGDVFLCVDADEKDAVDKEIEVIGKQAEKSGVFIDIYSIKDLEKRSLRDNNDEFKFCFLLAGLMLGAVASIISILSILSWVSDYHDIGILMANGFTNADIFRIILFENIFKLIGSAVFSLAYICVSNHGEMYSGSMYSLKIYTGITVIYIIILFISAVISYSLITRISPSSLLRGEQL